MFGTVRGWHEGTDFASNGRVVLGTGTQQAVSIADDCFVVWGVSCGALWSEACGACGALSGDIMIGGHCVTVLWYCGDVV